MTRPQALFTYCVVVVLTAAGWLAWRAFGDAVLLKSAFLLC